MSLGATYLGNGRSEFLVWAPKSQSVEVQVIEPCPQRVPMRSEGRGYFKAVLDDAAPESLYRYVLDGGKERPDPASRSQPRGVHGPSQIIDSSTFAWTDRDWTGIPLDDYIIYELHAGTYTREGTFDGVIRHLDALRELGITAVEVMPVAQFPGARNWGYDGVFPFAVQNSYGGPDGLRRLVNACHERGLALVLDVVYNHLGHEGNYLADFGPYFTGRYQTPWGPAINFDGPQSDEVVRYFKENAAYWLTEFHVDALRLDAIHAITDCSAQPFLRLLAQSVRQVAGQTGRCVYLIAESDLNDTRFIQSLESNGYGLDAQWSDDLHHALHTLLTGERTGYYQDFGKLEDLAQALREGFVYSGQYSAYRARRHGNSSHGVPARQFVVCAQNHDQVGNRMMGERLASLVSFEALKLAAGVVILSPFIPLLFMGEEYGESAPFLFFTSHEDPALIEGVRKGRRDEFARFLWQGEPPDPQAEATFLASKLRLEERNEARHRILSEFYRELIRLRKECRPMASLSKSAMEVTGWEHEKVIAVRRWCGREEAVAVFNFGSAAAACSPPMPGGLWRKRLDSSDARWSGSGGRAPDALASNGSAAMEICSNSFLLYTHDVKSERSSALQRLRLAARLYHFKSGGQRPPLQLPLQQMPIADL
ncbi:MAG: malto-oligosyltrehalose trehalohydrolase [Terriglobia bacterium]